METPVVSICCITFNHVNYIRDCINGFISQKTDFLIEILIFDDASTDGTQEIIKEYSSKYSNIITFLQKENQWSKKKYGLIDWLFPSAKGKYIALCEGDDYWTDHLKLQKQVDFLEKNHNYVMCYHRVHILENQVLIDDILNCKNISNLSSYNDLLCFGKYMQTCSVVYRNTIPLFPFNKVNFTNDYILWFWVSQFGNIYRIDQVMAVYRIGSGIWSVKSSFDKRLESLNALIEVKKIVRDTNDIVILDYRIKALTLELLPLNLQRLNLVNDSLNNYLSKNIHFINLIISLLLKLKRILFTRNYKILGSIIFLFLSILFIEI
jgi:glycosyltransferase involved in cell wall biosynthesis